MPARKEHRSDKMPCELERDAKCAMEPMLAGALIHRLSDIDLMRLNGWLEMERRAAADEIWERHAGTIAATKGLLSALIECELFIRVLGLDSEPAAKTAELARSAIAKAKGEQP